MRLKRLAATLGEVTALCAVRRFMELETRLISVRSSRPNRRVCAR